MSAAPDPTRLDVARARAAALIAWLRACVATAVQSLPGVAAVTCAGVGTYLLAGPGWALLVLVPFLLVLDHRAGR